LGNTIQRVRSVFKFAYDDGLIDKPLRFGPGFARPSKKPLRPNKAEQGTNQRSEVRGQRSEVRGQRSEVNPALGLRVWRATSAF